VAHITPDNRLQNPCSELQTGNIVTDLGNIVSDFKFKLNFVQPHYDFKLKSYDPHYDFSKEVSHPYNFPF